MKVLSVVCARSGSKGLDNKCVEKVNGRMLIEYSIEYSLALGKDVATVVTTDIKRVIGYCRSKDIPYIGRDRSLCRDVTRIEHVLRDAIMRNGRGAEYCSVVYGNIPTRYPEIFHRALRFLTRHKEYDAAMSMHKLDKFHPAWMFDYNTGMLKGRKKTPHLRQLVRPKMMHDGHTIIFRVGKFLKKCELLRPGREVCLYSTYGDRIKPIINDRLVIDIDEKRDMDLARAFIEMNERRGRS